MSTIKVDTVQSSAGVVKPLPQVTCHLNMKSTQTIVGSVGVSSITDTGTGTTDVTFSATFSDTAFTSTTAGGAGPASASSGMRWSSIGAGPDYGGTVYTTSAVRIIGASSSAARQDLQYAMVTCIPT